MSTKFDFMSFGYSPGHTDMFVVNAKKYTTEQTIEICKLEYDFLFTSHKDIWGREREPLREPSVSDVQTAGCAFRFGNPEWPEGCYTLVDETENGAFPVRVIDFGKLRKEDA